jgi:outer membrane protein assembly factor BamB
LFITNAGDWPQYRGPTHDGVSMERIRTNWKEAPPAELWRVPIGAGLSSLAVAQGRVFTLAKGAAPSGAAREFVVALDADSGEELWATDLDEARYPNAGVGTDDGPRGTPTVDGDLVYAFGAYLRLVCLRVEDGSLVWERDFREEFGSSVIKWQNAASPLLVGDLVYVNCNAPSGGRLTALNKTDGTEVWREHPDDAMTQATPIAATVAGVPQVIFFAQSGLVAVDPDNGEELWRYPFSYSTSSAASPVVGGDVVYCSAAYSSGAGAVRITNSGGTLSIDELWRLRIGAVANHWATPVYLNGHLYGHYGQSTLDFKCIDLATGDEPWLPPYRGFGLVDDKLLVLSADGELALVEPDPTAYREIARHRALNGKCWNTPAVSNGRIYVRSTLEVAALDVAETPPPEPPEFTGATIQQGQLILTWTGSGVLQQATQLDGVWEDLPGVAGGYSVAIEPGAPRFFRIRP